MRRKAPSPRPSSRLGRVLLLGIACGLLAPTLGRAGTCHVSDRPVFGLGRILGGDDFSAMAVEAERDDSSNSEPSAFMPLPCHPEEGAPPSVSVAPSPPALGSNGWVDFREGVPERAVVADPRPKALFFPHPPDRPPEPTAS